MSTWWVLPRSDGAAHLGIIMVRSRGYYNKAQCWETHAAGGWPYARRMRTAPGGAVHAQPPPGNRCHDEGCGSTGGGPGCWSTSSLQWGNHRGCCRHLHATGHMSLSPLLPSPAALANHQLGQAPPHIARRGREEVTVRVRAATAAGRGVAAPQLPLRAAAGGEGPLDCRLRGARCRPRQGRRPAAGHGQLLLLAQADRGLQDVAQAQARIQAAQTIRQVRLRKGRPREAAQRPLGCAHWAADGDGAGRPCAQAGAAASCGAAR
jgi:hypothetical protein